MLKGLLFITGGLVVGFGAGQVIDGRSQPNERSFAASGTGLVTESPVLAQRVGELETRLAAEAQQREAMAEEIALLAEQLAAIRQTMAASAEAPRGADQQGMAL